MRICSLLIPIQYAININVLTYLSLFPYYAVYKFIPDILDSFILDWYSNNSSINIYNEVMIYSEWLFSPPLYTKLTR